MVYVGQTRSRKLIANLRQRGWGESTCRGELPPRRTPWFFDNGAFRDWRAGRPFDADRFMADLDWIANLDTMPDFVVAPDIVGGGAASLELSRHWCKQLAGFDAYLAVQNGMTPGLDHGGFAGIFVGGDLPWKLATGGAWVQWAHSIGLPCHIGRVGTPNRVHWARSIGADSIDSCLPLWSADNLRRFALALEQPQMTIWDS